MTPSNPLVQVNTRLCTAIYTIYWNNESQRLLFTLTAGVDCTNCKVGREKSNRCVLCHYTFYIVFTHRLDFSFINSKQVMRLLVTESQAKALDWL